MINLIAFSLNLFLGVQWYISHQTVIGIIMSSTIFSGLIAAGMLKLMITFIHKAKKLKKEKLIHE